MIRILCLSLTQSINMLSSGLRRRKAHQIRCDKEMDEYDYTAMTFLPEELESGAVNALNAGDLEAAQTFVKALNRQKFIKAYQTEENR